MARQRKEEEGEKGGGREGGGGGGGRRREEEGGDHSALFKTRTHHGGLGVLDFSLLGSLPGRIGGVLAASWVALGYLEAIMGRLGCISNRLGNIRGGATLRSYILIPGLCPWRP